MRKSAVGFWGSRNRCLAANPAHINKSGFAFFLITVLISIFIPNRTSAYSAEREKRITPLVQSVYKVLPSVVYLSAERLLATSNEQDGPFSSIQQQPELHQAAYSLGSGCIVDEDGLILTNAHVIQRAARILVTLSNGSRHWADVIAADTLNDLALLRIRNMNGKFQPVAMAEPGDLLLGETVIIVGNPYGLGGTIVEGVLSAVNRRISYKDLLLFDDLLQTDAAINPGHSGAPLLNLNGEMIGISLANFQDAPGISFAIPQQRISMLLGHWLIPERFGDVSVGLIPGIRRESSGDLVFFVQEILPDSPAADSGLQAGMPLSHLNGKTLEHSIMEISGPLWKSKVGDIISLVSNGASYEITATAMPELDWRKVAKMKLNLGLEQMTPHLAKVLKYPEEIGVIVSAPPPGNPQIKRGDLLIQLGDTIINSPEELSRCLSTVRYGQDIQSTFLEHNPENQNAPFIKKITTLTINRR